MNSGVWSGNTLTNVSQINFLDRNRPLIFLEESDIDKQYLLEHYNEPLEYSEAIQRIDKIFGIGAPYVMTGASGVSNNYNSMVLTMFPNVKNNIPNTWNVLLDSPGTLEGVMHVPTLRYLRSKNKNYYVEDNGNLTLVPSAYDLLNVTGVPSVGTSGLSASIYMPIFKGGERGVFSNWWYLHQSEKLISSTTKTAQYIFSLTGVTTPVGNTKSISNVFVRAGNPEPDFDGPPPPLNPYEPGGPSGPTDPDLPPGTFDDESDNIPDSSLPTISAANTGFTRIYNPTLSQVQALARYLWTDESVIETIWNHIKQFFENPMEAIIGFNLVPVPVPDAGTENFALMYIDTGVSMTVAANQFVDVDCGTVELKRYYGSALDQSPYTKVSCFLPYIGTVNLNTDEVMGTTLQVKYRVDIVSGSCVAKIFVDGNCLYQYSGHCAITIPISSADFSSYVSAAISVGKLAAAAITAGAGAAMATGVADVSQQTNQVVTTTQVTNTTRNPDTGRQITTGTTTTVQTRESPADQSSTQASFSGLAPQNVANTVGAIMSSKPHIEHSGSFSGNSGYLGVRRPFLIIERPNMCMPANYQALNGFPSMITMELSTCKGFTRVQQVQLTGMGRATNPEQAEVMELLKSGVIL